MSLASSLYLRVLVGLVLAISWSVGLARPSRVDLPTPAGLSACKPADPLTQMVQQGLSQFGELIGCFLSAEQIQLHGTNRNVAQPLEYAFALNISPSSGPYSEGDVRSMFLKVSGQWKNYKPLDHQVRKEYEKQVNDLIARSLPKTAPTVNVKLEPPILVSMERTGNESYMVISIRQRTFFLAGDAATSTAVDATAITLRKGSLVRQSLVRELRDLSDITTVRKAMDDWLARSARSVKSR